MHSINTYVVPVIEQLITRADELQLKTHILENGATIIDAGIDAGGGDEAGCLIANICLGGLGEVQIAATDDYPYCSQLIRVATKEPVLACLASQYAGWSLAHGEGKGAFFALGSGPARAQGSKEPLFAELNYRDNYRNSSCLVIETDRIPPTALIDQIATQCQVAPAQFTVILTPTTSIAGTVQIISRVVETALHKIHTLGFPLTNIVQGQGQAPVCPIADDFLTAMGRTNDSILFAGEVTLEFAAEYEASLEELAKKLPSDTSSDYGKPFKDTFLDYDSDFYRIDPMLFSPAKVHLKQSGKTISAGHINLQLLEQSFHS